MAVKVSDLTTESAPASTDILIIADPTTGVARKITVSALKTYMDGLGGGVDTTAPVIISATATGASSIVIVFSESVTVTTSGWSFKLNGSAWAISSVSGSGNTWTFNMSSSATSSDTILRSYNSTTGTTLDTSANELVTFTDSAVTNSIPGAPASLPHTSNFTASNGTLVTAYTPDAGNLWTAASGTQDIQGNVWSTLTFSTLLSASVTEVGQTTYTIEAAMKRLDNDQTARVYFRYTDLNNYMLCDIGNAIAAYGKVVAGVYTGIGNQAFSNDTNYHTMKVVCRSGDFDFYIDNSLITTQSVDGALTGTKVGIGGYDGKSPVYGAGGVLCDSFTVVS